MALEAASGPASSSASSFGPGQELPPLENTEEKEDQTFEEYVGNLFLNNKFSGLETLTLMQKAKDAGTPGLESWSRLGGGGKHPQNAHRDLLRALLKKKDGPNLYWANIPLWDQDSSTSVLEPLPFLLPHEVFAHYMKSRPLKDVRSDLDPCLSKLIEDYCHKLKLESSTFVPLGLHADGVPHQKRKTIEVFHWNFLGEANTSPSLSRILATVVESSFACQCGCQGRHTLDAIMEVLCWSFRSIITGSFPKTRHDGSAFTSQEKQRSTLVGPLGAHGGILQVRGDWSYYKRLFSFPGWQSKRICWRCAASREGDACPYTVFGEEAAWRSQRYSAVDFWKEYHKQVKDPSPLFQLPGFSLDFIAIDILHALDLGVTADIIGNVFFEFIKSGLCEGTNKKAKVAHLWRMLKAHYGTHKTPNRLQALTYEMIKGDKKPPKMRTKGAETRSLVPFTLELSLQMHQAADTPHSLTVVQCCSGLMDFYQTLMLEPFDPNALSKACRKVCLMYGALHQEASRAGDFLSWKPKPKMHMMQELAEYQVFSLGCPKHFWTYMDEDYVGRIAKMSASRGGPKSAARTAQVALQRYQSLGD